MKISVHSKLVSVLNSRTFISSHFINFNFIPPDLPAQLTRFSRPNMSLPQETPPAEPQAAVVEVDLDKMAEEMNTRGPLVRAALIQAALPTAAVDFAMSLVAAEAFQRSVGLWILQATQDKLDNPDAYRQETVGEKVEMKFTPEMHENDEFTSWWYDLEERDEAASKILFDYEALDPLPSDSDDGENEESEEVETPVFGARTTGASADQSFGFAETAGAKDDGTSRLASRLKAEAEDGFAAIKDPTTYRERSRSPLDEEGAARE